MHKLASAISLSLSALALVQCSPKTEAPAASASASPAAIDYSYDIALAITPLAAEKVKARGGKLEIAALYYGNARPATAHLAHPSDGTIHLNTDKVQVEPVDQTIHMTGEGARTENLQHITGQKPLVQINAYSTTAGKKDGLVVCSVFQDYVANAQGRPLVIRCDLS